MFYVFLFFRYREDGHTKGEPSFQPPNPIRMQWDISTEVRNLIYISISLANISVQQTKFFHILFFKSSIR